MNIQEIDIHFDVQTDSNGKDPDYASKTLKTYHQALWSKPLPNGQMMQLEIEKNCLKWGDMCFGCDSITASFLHWRFPLKEYVEQHIPNFAEWKKEYWHKTYTIGGSIIFPMHRWSMNQARQLQVQGHELGYRIQFYFKAPQILQTRIYYILYIYNIYSII